MHKSRAALWPVMDPSYQRMLDTVYDQVKGVIMGALQQQAARMINQQYAKLVGGTVGSGAMFITNWANFLITEPERETNKYLNDYLSQLTRGRGSYSSYVSASSSYVLGASDSKANEGFFGGKVLGEGDSADQEAATTVYSSGNYYEDLLDSAKRATTEKTDSEITYEGDPSQALSEDKTFRKHNEGMYGLIFRPLFVINARNKAFIYQQNQEKIAFAQSIAYEGYKGTTRNGQVITPGSLISQTMANVEDLGNKVIAAAENPAQVISSVVANVITQAALTGIGAASSIVDKQVNQVTDKAMNKVNGTLNQYGPSVLYNSGSR